MGLIDKYPYTNYAGINLDYYIQKVNSVDDTINGVAEAIPGYVKEVTGSENVITVTDGAGNNHKITITGIPNNPVLTFSVNEYTSDIHLIRDINVDSALYLDGDISSDDVYAAIKNGALVMALLKDSRDNLIIAQPLKWSEDGLIYMELLCRTATSPVDVWEVYQFTVQPDRSHSWESGNHYELTRRL